MRVIALLALVFGFVAQLILDGQTFTHAVFGCACGVVAVACGLRSTHKDPRHRWEGWILAGFGFALGLWCTVILPSARHFQDEFNGRKERIRKVERQER